MSDIEKYVDDAINGDSEAFARLYELSKRQVYFTCLKFLKNEDDAQDITQEVYITVLKKLPSLTDKSSFQPWVNRIAVNKCKNFLKTRHDVSLDEMQDEGNYPEIPDEDMLPEDYVLNAAKRRIVMDIMESVLSDIQYQTVIMFYFNNMSVAEIAEIIESPVGTVTYRLNVARAKIKKGVLEYEEKNKDRLHAIVPIIPFLTRLFNAEADSIEVPNLLPEISVAEAEIAETAADTASAAGTAAKSAGFMSTVTGKVVAGVVALAVIGGGIGLWQLNSDSDTKTNNNNILETSIQETEAVQNAETNMSANVSSSEETHHKNWVDYEALDAEYNRTFDVSMHINCMVDNIAYFRYYDRTTNHDDLCRGYYAYDVSTGNATKITHAENSVYYNGNIYAFFNLEDGHHFCKYDTNGNLVAEKIVEYNANEAESAEYISKQVKKVFDTESTGIYTILEITYDGNILVDYKYFDYGDDDFVRKLYITDIDFTAFEEVSSSITPFQSINWMAHDNAVYGFATTDGYGYIIDTETRAFSENNSGQIPFRKLAGKYFRIQGSCIDITSGEVLCPYNGDTVYVGGDYSFEVLDRLDGIIRKYKYRIVSEEFEDLVVIRDDISTVNKEVSVLILDDNHYLYNTHDGIYFCQMDTGTETLIKIPE